MSEAFTITQEECNKLHEEYLVNDCLFYLMKTKELIGGEKTINEAIEELKTKTRFADEVIKLHKYSCGNLAQDYLNLFK